MNRLSLGTVQFGTAYGVANKSGKVKTSEVDRMIQYCRDHGILDLDTASSYGDAETVLGEVGVDGFNIVSKFPPLRPNGSDLRDQIYTSVSKSLENLKVESLYGALFHRASDIVDIDKVNEIFRELKSDGLVLKTGVSYYTEQEILKTHLNDFSIDIAQVPVNIIDRTFASAKSSIFKGKDIEVHGRSVFLQGLLLMNINDMHPYFSRWTDLWKRWESVTGGNQQIKAQICLSYLKQLTDIDCIVVGAQSLEQLSKIHEAFDLEDKDKSIDGFFSNDPDLIYPYNWKAL